jgi:hypothetical protein
MLLVGSWKETHHLPMEGHYRLSDGIDVICAYAARQDVVCLAGRPLSQIEERRKFRAAPRAECMVHTADFLHMYGDVDFDFPYAALEAV